MLFGNWLASGLEDTTCFSSVESQLLATAGESNDHQTPPASAAWSLNFSLQPANQMTTRYQLKQMVSGDHLIRGSSERLALHAG